jgi:hypothetical protein
LFGLDAAIVGLLDGSRMVVVLVVAVVLGLRQPSGSANMRELVER